MGGGEQIGTFGNPHGVKPPRDGLHWILTMVLCFGDPVICAPFKWENNPEVDSQPFVGMFIGRRRIEWSPSEYNILGPNGSVWLWSNRWAVEIINETEPR